MVDMVSWFFGGFCIHHRPGKFFFETRKVLQKIIFQWWLCTFFFSELRIFLRKKKTQFSLSFLSLYSFPKGPFRTKNTTVLESVVFCYRRSFSQYVPFSCLSLLEKQACLSYEFSCEKCSEISPIFSVERFMGAAQRGGNFTSFLQFSGPLFMQQNEPFVRKTCTRVKGTP